MFREAVCVRHFHRMAGRSRASHNDALLEQRQSVLLRPVEYPEIQMNLGLPPLGLAVTS